MAPKKQSTFRSSEKDQGGGNYRDFNGLDAALAFGLIMVVLYVISALFSG